MSSTGTTGVGRSTGPRTPEGKARSSLNAVTHGLTAKTPLLPGEDPAEFREAVWAVVEDLAPVGPVEHRLACRAGVLLWKRQRVDEAEREVFDGLRYHYEEEA